MKRRPAIEELSTIPFPIAASLAQETVFLVILTITAYFTAYIATKGIKLFLKAYSAIENRTPMTPIVIQAKAKLETLEVRSVSIVWTTFANPVLAIPKNVTSAIQPTL